MTVPNFGITIGLTVGISRRIRIFCRSDPTNDMFIRGFRGGRGGLECILASKIHRFVSFAIRRFIIIIIKVLLRY